MLLMSGAAMVVRASGRHWIDATLAKGLAARQTAKPHPYSSGGPMDLHRFPHILGTGWVKSAGCGKQRRQKSLVTAKCYDEELAHRSNTWPTSASISANGRSSTMRRGLKTKLQPTGKVGRLSLTASRTRRRIRLRRTALPKARGVVNPALVGSPSPRNRQKATKLRFAIFLPVS